ncbi:carboxypeptidase regulatory-like domain-containing protein [Archangium lipolyticum]|uniref:carboxypeptidase regulatory-like domain-containing protein n=1 Tax=Archangium lipolyticum TaxID=2970465 RepID=UPI00214A0B11|nr:carboxypeptidase regulatory-like domain-containing protein [Archangium lipolyticum]
MRRTVLPSLVLPLLALSPGCQQVACTPTSSKAPSNAPSARPPSGPPGVIEGEIRLSGPVPALPALPTSPSVAALCGATMPDRSLVVDPRGALSYVVVALADGTVGPEPDPDAPSALLDQRRCAFEPPVLAARAGTSLEVRNLDPLLHNVNALAGSQQPVLNVALPLEGSRVRRQLPTAPGILQVRCDLHPWMSAAVRTFEHPWFTTTDASGHFRLEVPAGTHSVILWHPRLPGVSRTVSVRAGQTVRLDYTWAVGEVRGLSAPDAASLLESHPP